MESSEEHEKLLDECNENTEKLEKKMELIIFELKDQLMETLMTKQAEIEATVQNVSENLDIISAGIGEDSSIGRGATGSAVGVSRNSKGRVNSRGAVAAKKNLTGPDTENEISSVFQNDSDGAFKSALDASHADFLADLCTNYEEICTRRANIVDIPDSICEHIANSSQNICLIISQFTDSEAIQRSLKDKSGDLDYASSLVDIRHERVNSFIADVARVQSESHPQSGMLRNEARNKFIGCLQRALMIAMSKHDQVLVVGNSRLGRMKIPSCIACDRPLLTKVSNFELR